MLDECNTQAGRIYLHYVGHRREIENVALLRILAAACRVLELPEAIGRARQALRKGRDAGAAAEFFSEYLLCQNGISMSFSSIAELEGDGECEGGML